MLPRRPLRALLLAALALLVAGLPVATGGASSPGVPEPTVLNVGVAGEAWGSWVALDGGGLGFYVPEAGQAGTDLNGDGDTADHVVHVWLPGSAAPVNLGVGVTTVAYGSLVALDGGGFGFGVPEGSQSADLNGDGDKTDIVVHAWRSQGGTVNLGLAIKSDSVCCPFDLYEISRVPGGGMTFLVPESSQGDADRNADGDRTDAVAAVWDGQSAAAANTGWAASRAVGTSDGSVALLASEAGQDGTDLNTDGDAKDTVPQLWRPSGVTNVRVAARNVVPMRSNRMAVLVPESGQDGEDRNGDGDTADVVMAVWDPTTSPAVQNLGVAEANVTTNILALDQGHLAFRGDEPDEGADLNGDGDEFDKVVHIWDPATRKVTNLGHEGTDMVALAGGGLAFEGPKLEVWSPASNRVESAGLRPNGIAQSMPDGRVAFGITEWGVQKDLDLDGDTEDHWIPHIWDPVTRTAAHVPYVGEGKALTEDGFAFQVSELSMGPDVDGNGNSDDIGPDLDGDGDAADGVLFVWVGDRVVNMKLAGGPVTSLGGNRFAAVVGEMANGQRDLNGDGDLGDAVLHIVTVPYDPANPTGNPSTTPTVPAPTTTSPTVPATGTSTTSSTMPPATATTGTTSTTGGSGPDGPSWPDDEDESGGIDDELEFGAGYWMLGDDGAVYGFGEASFYGDADPGAGAAVDLEATPWGDGYWVVDERGRVSALGEAVDHGYVPAGRLGAGEKVTSLSATPTGGGYWVFTSRGRAFTFGDARHLGDMSGRTLNAPVLDSVPTPSGDGYYMVAADGGIFAFGDAVFRGSMGNRRLNRPVESLVPDIDGDGYWLVASDGGIFAFSAPFWGSMGDKPLNAPVTGMVPFGAGYLMVAEDGGIFNFSDQPFLGSLGGLPLPAPITAVAAY